MARFTEYKLCPALKEHVKDLMPDLRPIDRLELGAASGLAPEDAICYGLERSTIAYSVMTTDGRPIVLFGSGPIAELNGASGCPWMVASNLLERPDILREFIRQSRPYADLLARGFDYLINRVHAENHLAIRWLKWLGFSFAEEPHSVNGEFFYSFWKDCRKCAN